MTACKDSLNGKKAVSATLAGVLAVGMVPAAAFAATDAQAADTQDEQGIELQVYDKAADFKAGTVLGVTGVDGVAYDDPANISISLSETPTFTLTKVQTKEDKAIVDLLPEQQNTARIVKANKKGELPSGTTYDNAKTVTPDKAGTYYAIFQVKSDAFASSDANSAYNGAEIALKFTVTSTTLSEAVAYEVNAKDKTDLSDTTFTYNGAAQSIGFKIGDTKLNKVGYDTKNPAKGDYTVVYYKKGTSQTVSSVTDAGDYTAIVTGAGDYANSKASIDFTVEKLDLSKATIVLSGQSADLLTANIGQINDLKAHESGETNAAFTAIVDKITAKFTSGPDGSVVTSPDAIGTYKYTVTANKEAGGTDNKNITGTATVSYDKTANKAVTWTYDNGTIIDGGTYAVDHSLSSDDAHYKADFDPAKLVAKPAETDADYKTLATTHVVKDKDGNEVDDSVLSTPGTWTVVYTIDAKANEYNYGGTFTQTVTVTEGEIDGNAAVVVKQDGKVTSAPTFTYDGTNVLDKLDISVTVNGQAVDYTLEVTKDNKKVDEAVDNGTYAVTVKAEGYSFKGTSNQFSVVVNAVDMSHVRVAGESTLYNSNMTVNYTFTPYTGEAITPSFEYQTNYAECQNDSSIEPEYAPIPEELYTVAYGYNKDLKKTTSDAFTGVTEVKKVGSYKASFTKVSSADKKGNYALPTEAIFNVSDHKFFYDVQATDWFYTDVNKAANLGYMNGYDGTKIFGPNDTITRAQVAQVLYNMAGGEGSNLPEGAYDETQGYKSFDDVNGKMWYGKAIAWAKAAGVVNGYGDGTFHPESPVTREEFAQMLANYAKVAGTFEAADGSALAELPDASSVSDWAEEAVAWAVENGYMGKAGVVNPQSDIIRAEAATMAVRYQPEKLA